MSEPTKTLKQTLNLPQTDFPIRAQLPKREPEIQAQWEAHEIYEKSKAMQAGFSENYTLHDGPPYPNGNIHIGHALNKVLKDIVMRSKIGAGYASPYVPGWDCHGLPIEVQVLKELKANNEEHRKEDVTWFRKRCHEFAVQYIDTQRQDFKRLGIWGEWDTPYLTLNPEYEAEVVKLFGEMAANDLIYKGRKPIHWCPTSQTALAEAEIEYHDHRSPSIYVRFDLLDTNPALSEITTGPVGLLVWTTTPWTLPANLAIAVHPEFTYVVFKHQDQAYVCVDTLQDKLTELFEMTDVEVLGTIKGKALEGLSYQHPFMDRQPPVVLADYVTDEDGTGLVHTAPGHGQDDYMTGLKYKLDVLTVVDGEGKYTADVPQWEGLFYADANKEVGMTLEASGHLMSLKFIKHSYPHNWRTKSPVIFRATEQWFVAMDSPMPDGETLRQKALNEIKNVKWHPDWGEKRLSSMVENRPDWCISRQRYWGIPVPVVTCQSCGHSEMTGEFNEALVDVIRREGTMAWFERDAHDLLPEHLVCSSCGERHFAKENDILDVWFESGSSFGSVVTKENNMSLPAEMYLEGSDQHRGWFQSSLMIGVGAKGHAPYRDVLTHGFIVDEKGRKMSKSQGNVLAPEQLVKTYGADVLRWWVASSDFKNDTSVSENILKQAQDSFGKVRNTIRFCLSNLYDFDATSDLVPQADLQEIDQWALAKLAELTRQVSTHYAAFNFHLVTQRIHEFCAVTMSSLYLDMVKDRLYCDAATSDTRRSTQTVLHIIVDQLLPLLSPILVHTAEETYTYFNRPNKLGSVHLEQQKAPLPENAELLAKWDQLLGIKDAVYQQLEKLRSDKVVGSFLEAEVRLTLAEPIDFSDWEALLIVSKVHVSSGDALAISVDKAPHEKCERCWKRLPHIPGMSICQRCAVAIKA